MMSHGMSGYNVVLNQAIAMHQKGDLEGAEIAYLQVIAAEAGSYSAFSNIGSIYLLRQQWQKAQKYLVNAVRLNPLNPEAHYNLGTALHQQGKLEEAIASYQEALAIRPSYPEAYGNLGVIFYQQGKLEEAIASYQQALTLRQNYPEVHYNLATIFQEQGKIEASIDSYQQVLLLWPTFAEAHYSLGLLFQQQAKLNEAITSYQQALDIRQSYPEAHYNLGLALYNLGKLEEAIASYQVAIALRSNYPKAHLGLSIALLHLDNCSLGWKEYEWRFQAMPNMCAMPSFEKWNGVFSDVDELILIEEQGIGDLLQFMRYGKILMQKIPKVSIAVQPNLCPLVEMTGIYDKVYSLPLTVSTLATGAKWIPILSVPGILGITRNAPLIKDSYIKVDQSRIEHWRKTIRLSSSLVVGINWQGNPSAENNNFKGRSLNLTEFASLSLIDNIQFVSLQKGFGSEQLEACSFLDKFVNCQNEISQTWDFIETAAIVQNCDLVITSDTSIAHLASAMGKPTWILLKKVPDWRWGMFGERCSWYPSARLFRQTQDGNWGDVLEKVKDELAQLVNNYFP